MSSLEDTLDPRLIRDAAKYVVTSKLTSITALCNRFTISEARSRRLLQVLENHGVLGPHRPGHVGQTRELLVERAQLPTALAALPKPPGGEDT